MTKMTNAQLIARVAELEAALAECRGDIVTHTTTDVGLVRHTMPLGVKGHNFTPSAVDAIRVYTWAEMAKGTERKAIIAALISQKFTPATVRARVARIFAGTDESCYSEEIRARLGLDELGDEDLVEDEDDDEDEESEEDEE